MESFRPTLYLKRSCPHCLKLHIFVTAAGLEERFAFTVFDDGDDTHRALRARIAADGRQPSFPAAEVAPGQIEIGSDELIARFANEAGVDPASLRLLPYYLDGVFRGYREKSRELRELRAKQTA